MTAVSPSTDLLSACFAATNDPELTDRQWRSKAIDLFIGETKNIIDANPTAGLAMALRAQELRDQAWAPRQRRQKLRSVRS